MKIVLGFGLTVGSSNGGGGRGGGAAGGAPSGGLRAARGGQQTCGGEWPSDGL